MEEPSRFLFIQGCIVLMIFMITILSALAPLRLAGKESDSRKKILSLISLFTAGVFLGAGLLHLLPDSVKKLEKAFFLMNFKADYPVAFLLSSMGFVVVWLVDSVCIGHDSTQTVAVAVAAGRKGGATIHKVRMTPVSTYGVHAQGFSEGGEECPLLIFPENPKYDETLDSVQQQASQDMRKPSGRFSVKFRSPLRSTGSHSSSWFERQTKLEEWTESDTCMVDSESADGSGGHHRHLPEHIHETRNEFLTFSENNKALPFILAILMSLHSYIAGLALGVSTRIDYSFIATLVAIVAHKSIEALAVGASFVKEDVSLKYTVGVIVLYSLMTPFGVATGMILTSALEGTSALLMQGVCQAFASGSFLYLTMHSAEEGDSVETSKVVQSGALIVGLVAMAVLAVWV